MKWVLVFSSMGTEVSDSLLTPIISRVQTVLAFSNTLNILFIDCLLQYAPRYKDMNKRGLLQAVQTVNALGQEFSDGALIFQFCQAWSIQCGYSTNSKILNIIVRSRVKLRSLQSAGLSDKFEEI